MATTSSSIDAWIEGCPLRPVGFTNDFNRAFVSSAMHLLMAFLHTEPSESIKDDVDTLFQDIVIGSPEVLTSDEKHDVQRKLLQLDSWHSTNIVSMNSMFLVLYHKFVEEQKEKDPTISIDLHYAEAIVNFSQPDFVPDVEFDKHIIKYLDSISTITFDDLAEALPHLQALERLWEKYSADPDFCAGRGDKFFVELRPVQIQVCHQIDDWTSTTGHLLEPFIVYDFGGNFSLGKVARKFRHGFTVAKKLAHTASKAIWSNAGAILEVEGVAAAQTALGTMKDVLEGKPLLPSFAQNVANATLSFAIDSVDVDEEVYGEGLPGCAAAFFNQFKKDSSYNPKVGRRDATDSTTAEWRSGVDNLAVQMADLAVDMFAKDVPNRYWITHRSILEAFGKIDDAINLATTAFAGRGSGKTTNTENDASSQEVMYYENYWHEHRRNLAAYAQEPFDFHSENWRSVLLWLLMSSGDPGISNIIDTDGDWLDVGDLKALEGKITDAEQKLKASDKEKVTLEQEKEQIKTQSDKYKSELDKLVREFDKVTVGRVEVPTLPQMARYVNWDSVQSDEFALSLSARWMHLKDALELVDALYECNFKYDSARDQARTLLTGDPFNVTLDISFNRRFREDVSLVCQSYPEVVNAISDILGALNYRNEQDVRGPSEQASKKVRETTPYNDAALAYVKAVAHLSKVFTKNAMTRGKFERRFGLYWL